MTADLPDLCRKYDLSWGQACWLAEVAGDDLSALSADDGRRVEECVRASVPFFRLPTTTDDVHRGGCLPLEMTDDERSRERRADLRHTRHMALWNVAARLTQRKSSGPSFLDDEADDVDPRAAMLSAWKEWRALDADTTNYQLAWVVGALRLLGIAVDWDGTKPSLRMGSRRSDECAGVLNLLKTHRERVIAHLRTGEVFDSADWQKSLLTEFVGDWCVWGRRVGGVGGLCRESVYPVLLADFPPFYDTAFIYRPDAWRAIPAEAVAVVRTDHEVGRHLPIGGVYLGPAVEDYPTGKGKAASAEAAFRKRHGFTVNRVNL